MREYSESITELRFTVILVDVDLTTDEVHKTDLRYFDEFSDACQWIKTHASLYGERSSVGKGVNRYFRIEKRYYVI